MLIIIIALNSALVAEENKPTYHLEIGFEKLTYSDDRYIDKTEYMQVKFPYTDKIIVLAVQNIDKYGKNDKNIEGEIYFELDDKQSGSIGFSASPTSNFMPIYSLWTHMYKGIDPVELGFGYQFSKYSNQNINTIVPEYRYYLPNDWYSNQAFYYVLDNKSFALSNKIGKDVENRYKYHIGYIYSDSKEGVEGLDMFANTKSNRYETAGEIYINRYWIFGANLSKEFYKNSNTGYKFDKASALLYIRRLW